MARDKSRATTINYEETNVAEALLELTGGRGPDACIDAVGLEAHACGLAGIYDRVKQATFMETDRPHALREAILACRAGGTLSIPGVYGGWVDKIPFGAIVNKALTIKTGQTHVQRYLRPLLERIEKGEIDPSFVITHRLRLAEAPQAYQMFSDKQDECIKVVLKP
jgi:threonine dehydrogenase-like Zn-dependent dehydrogenase